MGQKAAHETFISIIGAFVKNRRWTQAALGRAVGVSTEAVRKHLLKMQEDGWPLTDEKDGNNVVWRVPAQWYPGLIAFDADEIPDLLRALARSPKSAGRQRILETVYKRLPLKTTMPAFESAVRAPEISSEEEEWVELFEDAAAKKVSIKMHYSTASRRDDADRFVSVHHVETGYAPRFLATCHRDDKLKWFRVAGVSNAKLAKDVDYRDRPRDEVTRVLDNTVAGYHAEGTPVRCTFLVAHPKAAWVKRSLLRGMKAETIEGGIRVTIETAAVFKVAEYVVQLGREARPETPELAQMVIDIAEGALQSALASVKQPVSPQAARPSSHA